MYPRFASPDSSARVVSTYTLRRSPAPLDGTSSEPCRSSVSSLETGRGNPEGSDVLPGENSENVTDLTRLAALLGSEYSALADWYSGSGRPTVGSLL